MLFILQNKDKYKDLSGSLKSYVRYHPQNKKSSDAKIVSTIGHTQVLLMDIAAWQNGMEGINIRMIFVVGQKGEQMSDLIDREDAIDAIQNVNWYHQNRNKDMVSGANSSEHQAWYKAEDIYKTLEELPSVEPERHYCRECKWSKCQINVDKYGRSETYWYCLNWYGGTDEEGFCHEWERRTDEQTD